MTKLARTVMTGLLAVCILAAASPNMAQAGTPIPIKPKNTETPAATATPAPAPKPTPKPSTKIDGKKVIPLGVDWAAFVKPDVYAKTPEKWRNFGYNDLLKVPADQNYGNNVWSYVKDYCRGDGLILKAAELYFDKLGLGLEGIRQLRRDNVEAYLADIRVKIEVDSKVSAYLPNRGQIYEKGGYNIFMKQSDVDGLLDLIPGLAASDVNLILFYNDGGFSYEPGMVDYKGHRYWVLMVDPAISTGRGVHDLIQTLQCRNTVNTMTWNAGVKFDHTNVITDPQKLAAYRELKLETNSIFPEWDCWSVLGIDRNQAINFPPELGVPLDDRPTWFPQCADSFYAASKDDDWSAYISEADYYHAWLQLQPRTVALDQLGNEIDMISALVKDLRGMVNKAHGAKENTTLPARK